MISKLVSVGIEKNEKDKVCRLSNLLETPPNGNLISRVLHVH